MRPGSPELAFTPPRFYCLNNGYGVLIGIKTKYYRDDADDLGRFYHGNIEIRAKNRKYHCAIDVDPKNTPDGIQWRVATLDRNAFSQILGLSDGWHALASNDTSGALDYIRSGLLAVQPGQPTWESGVGTDALLALEGVIEDTTRFYIFGEPFGGTNNRSGVHNIHQNQGDPVGGATISRMRSGRMGG
ncbi:hypothetical protein B0H67DRAFT_673310 [Lasiosphaeris hirsuta]|uniref:DUF2278 family protein n=1 Tax=Lasiosphaeris hirsuta TaxID=260670 RepID=A0AA39ZVQ0_9PEZI|nr:hypothetical protein B0H67DRAFT_673310 [Lasiosphaeris hirsuta]